MKSEDEYADYARNHPRGKSDVPCSGNHGRSGDSAAELALAAALAGRTTLTTRNKAHFPALSNHFFIAP
ncbi:MAG: hypothetical protein AB1461_16410 [Thermodesulfobacteriota bacterium]